MPIGFGRVSEIRCRLSVRHQNENTSTGSMWNGLITARQSSPLVLKLFAIYYLVQGLLLIALGVGGLILVDQNQNHLLVIKQWLRVVRLDPENHFIHWLLTKVLPVKDPMMETFSIGSFVYGGIAFVQGGGLLLSKPWASYLTVVVVGSFIPWELYSMLDDVTPLKLMTLCINAMIVGYLLMSELRARRVKNNCGEGNCHR
jgi:uncharacterized membrane protein (DUF2068 family)